MRTTMVFLLLALACAGCTGSAKVETATSQVWHGGAAGSGGGTHYVVNVTKARRLVVRVEKIWVGERDKGWLPRFFISPQPNDTADFHVAPAGITAFTIKFSVNTPGQPFPRGNAQLPVVAPFDHPPHDLPADFTHGAVLYYSVDGKRGMWVVREFEALQPQNYP